MLLLDSAQLAFVTGPVSISASSRTATNQPVLSRSHGCRVTPDGARVTLLFVQPRATAFLEAIRETRAIAAVFSRPMTHKTIQLKADDAALGAIEPGDRELAQRYVEAFVQELTSLGYLERAIRNVFWYEPEDLVALRFSPRFAYDQTPGPRAGVPLQGSA